MAGRVSRLVPAALRRGRLTAPVLVDAGGRAALVVVGVVVRGVVRPVAGRRAAPVVIHVVPGRVVGPVPAAVDLGRLAAVPAAADDGTRVGEGDPPLQDFELEPVPDAAIVQVHGKTLVVTEK